MLLCESVASVRADGGSPEELRFCRPLQQACRAVLHPIQLSSSVSWSAASEVAPADPAGNSSGIIAAATEGV